MAITYPLTPPASPAPATITLRPRVVVGASISPFTLQHQVYRYAGEAWQMDVQLPPMKRAKAEPWIAFLLSLRGRFGTFSMGDPVGAVPRGSAAGTPLVAGASQTGDTLVTDGWTASQTGVLLAGDYIQFNTELHRVLTDADADSGGNATLDIWPRIRNSPADNLAIITSNAVGIWRLPSNEMPYTVLGGFYDIGFSSAEAL